MTDQKILADALKKFERKKVEVQIIIPSANLCFYDDLLLTFDSRLEPPHRLNLHDYKGNLLLLNLDKNRMNILFSEFTKKEKTTK